MCNRRWLRQEERATVRRDVSIACVRRRDVARKPEGSVSARCQCGEWLLVSQATAPLLDTYRPVCIDCLVVERN